MASSKGFSSEVKNSKGYGVSFGIDANASVVADQKTENGVTTFNVAGEASVTVSGGVNTPKAGLAVAHSEGIKANYSVSMPEDAGATLARVDVGGGDSGCGTAVRAVTFADPMNGLMVFDNGLVLSTADGGRSLSRRTPVPGPVSDMVAVSPSTAFATAGDAIFRTSVRISVPLSACAFRHAGHDRVSASITAVT